MKAPRWTIRIRLTALYAAVFLAAGVVLLTVIYGLMQQALYIQQTSSAVVNSAEFSVPADNAADEAQRQLKNQLYEQTLRDEFRQRTIDDMISRGAVVLGLLVVGGIGLGWLVALHSLRPVAQITATARRVSNGNLHERIELKGPQDELRELADTFDDMLSRLDQTFESHRRFVANASHELCTPLAINRTLIEVALRRPDAPPEVRELGSSLLQINDRQQEMVEGLLVLATSEQPLRQRLPVDLADLASKASSALATEAARRGVTIELEADPALTAGDPVLLERLVTNLTQNAIRHNIPQGWAKVRSHSDGDTVRLIVENTGPHVDPGMLDEIFEPFRRLTARMDSAEGSGLGLSIARTVAKAHGGSVTAVPRQSGGLTMVATLKAA